jgi:hypothetical protein
MLKNTPSKSADVEKVWVQYSRTQAEKPASQQGVTHVHKRTLRCVAKLGELVWFVMWTAKSSKVRSFPLEANLHVLFFIGYQITM